MAAKFTGPWRTSRHYPELLWQEWEEEHFLYDPRNGYTHVLNEAAYRILQSLRKRPMTFSEMTNELVEATGKDQDWVARYLHGHLEHLDELGLAMPVSRLEL